MARAITVVLQGYTPPKLRPALLCRLGERLHPDTVTDAWYAADCPPRFKPRDHGVTLRDTLKWKLACFLRGCRA
jgi:hypothetical protein